MPVVKYPRAAEPLWHEWDRKAQKDGLRHTVYAVNGDQYTGEWLDNLKHGKIHHLETSTNMGIFTKVQGVREQSVSGCVCSSTYNSMCSMQCRAKMCSDISHG